MINIQNSFSDLKNTNLIILLKSRSDLEKYNFLDISKNIYSKIDEVFSKQENTALKFYLDREDIEYITFLFYLDTQDNLEYFIWKNIDLFWKNITIEYQIDNILLDSVVLWKYDFDFYKKEKNEIDLNIICNDNFRQYLDNRLSTINNIISCRDLVNKPSIDKTPDKYLSFIRQIKFRNTKLKVLEYEDLKKHNLNLITSVWMWSFSKPKMVILERIVNKNLPTYWFVWKWITFDTWWLNIKLDDNMFTMKDDMAWSASVLFMMKELDEKDIKCNIIACLPIAENSISWESYRPWDILTSYSWKTVEIMNTDAEWRLILADWVSYLSKNYNLNSIITVATLTWACMVALWYNYAWIMWNNKQIINSLLKNTTFEKYWELPFSKFYVDKTKWTISDLKNLTSWIYVWSTMWGAFLYNFCLNNESFVHIDIAWVSFVKEKYWYFNPWATWFWVDSLSKMILWEF